MEEINGRFQGSSQALGSLESHESVSDYSRFLKSLNMANLQKHFVAQTREVPRGSRKNLEDKLIKFFQKYGI